MQINPKSVFLFFSSIVLLVFITIGSALAAEPARVLILPFNIHADKDLAYLKKGVAQMLAARLALKDKIVVIDSSDASLATEEIPATIDAAAALALGAKSGSDYVLFGNLTVLGNNVSTDASFFELSQKQPLLTFSEVGEAQGEVISHINLLAVRIKDEVFGRKTPASRPAVARSSPKTESSAPGRMHPEKLLDKEAAGGLIDQENTAAAREVAATLWKTQTFKFEIGGFAVGDVDGDKNNEAVFITKKRIFIYRHANRRFAKVAELKGPRSETLGGVGVGVVSPDNFIGVDVADINDNGTAEIFVTCLSETNRVKSFVLEWNGTEFITLIQDQNWYYRVVSASQKDLPILLGQKGGFHDAFSGPVYTLVWNNVRYVPEEKQHLPKWVMVYGLTYGDVLNANQNSALAIKKNGTLSIIDKDSQEEWASSEKYGGSNIFLLSPAEMKKKNQEGRLGDYAAHKGFYLQQRIFVSDLDRDKKNEVIVVKNHDVARDAFERFRKFTKGHFEGLLWDNVGLRSIWKTRKFSGYISDYDVADFDNDGTEELVFTVMAKKDGPISDPKSYIVAWSLKK